MTIPVISEQHHASLFIKSRLENSDVNELFVRHLFFTGALRSRSNLIIHNDQSALVA